MNILNSENLHKWLEVAILSYLSNEFSLGYVMKLLYREREEGERHYYTCFLMNKFITRIFESDLDQIINISNKVKNHISYDDFINERFVPMKNFVFFLDSHEFNVLYISDTEIYLVDYYYERTKQFRIKKFKNKEKAIKRMRCFFEPLDKEDKYSYENVFKLYEEENEEQENEELNDVLESLEETRGLSKGDNVSIYTIRNKNPEFSSVVNRLSVSRDKFIEELEYIKIKIEIESGNDTESELKQKKIDLALEKGIISNKSTVEDDLMEEYEEFYENLIDNSIDEFRTKYDMFLSNLVIN